MSDALVWHTTFSRQFVPVYPSLQTHEYRASPSLHVPLFEQGALAHSSTLISQ